MATVRLEDAVPAVVPDDPKRKRLSGIDAARAKVAKANASLDKAHGRVRAHQPKKPKRLNQTLTDKGSENLLLAFACHHVHILFILAVPCQWFSLVC